MSRPSEYSAERAAEICDLLAEGLSLRQIAARDGMPTKTTILRWLTHPDHADFRAQYARAREAQTEHFADEILEIADDGSNDWMERETEKGDIQAVVDHEHINRSRLRIDARKWLMAKLAPKKYGDKLQTEVSGPEGAPVQVELSAKESARRVAFLLAKAVYATDQETPKDD
jgi:hypothetical protein